MANRFLNQFILSMRKGHVVESGSFSIASNASVSSFDFSDLVQSVSRTALGEYTITLKDKWVGLLSIQCTMQTGDGYHAEVKSADVTSAKTIVINTVNLTAIDDVLSASKVFVTISLKNSTAR